MVDFGTFSYYEYVALYLVRLFKYADLSKRCGEKSNYTILNPCLFCFDDFWNCSVHLSDYFYQKLAKSILKLLCVSHKK